MKAVTSLKNNKFSKPQLVVFAIAFALIGFILVRTFAANPNLAGDLNNDNKVDITDVSILLSNYGTTNSAADVNGDGQVNVTDMSILLSHFGQSYAANCSTSSSTWQNNSINNQTGTFTASFNIIPNAQGVDAVTGFSNGSASDYSNLAAIIRFATNNSIDAINGAGYQAAATLNYTAGQNYQIRMVINTAGHTYDAYVTPPGGAEVKIANGYSFRSEQASTSQLNNWAAITSVGTNQVCNMQINGTTTPPPPPPPTGTTRNATPTNLASVISQSVSGDTIMLQDGNYPKLVLSKSFAAPGITIKRVSTAVFAGIDTNDQSGYNFDGIYSVIPVEAVDYNISPFYLHGVSQRINLTGAFKLQGGYDGIKVYGGSKDCTIDDGGAASDISGYGGDGIHVNQSTNLWIKSLNINTPWQAGPTEEHNDGIHAQAFTNLKIGNPTGKGVVITGLGTRSDIDSSGMFINAEGTGANGLLIDGVYIHWQLGRGLQLMNIGNPVTVRKLTITDSGIIGSSPAITFAPQTGQVVDMYGPFTGFTRADTYNNGGAGTIVWH